MLLGARECYECHKCAAWRTRLVATVGTRPTSSAMSTFVPLATDGLVTACEPPRHAAKAHKITLITATLTPSSAASLVPPSGSHLGRAPKGRALWSSLYALQQVISVVWELREHTHDQWDDGKMGFIQHYAYGSQNDKEHRVLPIFEPRLSSIKGEPHSIVRSADRTHFAPTARRTIVYWEMSDRHSSLLRARVLSAEPPPWAPRPRTRPDRRPRDAPVELHHDLDPCLPNASCHV
jgi:hypothetical protein